MFRHCRVALVVWLALPLAISPPADCPAQQAADEGVPLESLPLSPEASLQALHIRNGYRAELVAAEPLIADPTAIDWAPDGSLWVAEMADYPLGIDGQGKPGGRIRRLYDSDGDGRYDRSELFLEGVRFPTGILAWRSGVLVTAAPEIFYAEDSDGDGLADVRRTLFSGFLEGNQQLRVNGLRRGLDNWVYCASGSHHAGYGADSQILAHDTGNKVLLGSRDCRIRPDDGLIDPQSGPSQFGRNRDDWGNWFGVQNSHPLWHYVLSDNDIRRNPHFASPDPRSQIVVPRNPRVYPAKSSQKRFHSFEHANHYTSACSGMIYRDSLLFPKTSQQHAFTCEPFHNLVQHNLLSEQGPSFVANRDPAERETDFFASEDRWCRPVMVRTGPDGALWVVDLYRYMIEHPQWLPEEGQEELRPHFRAGEDYGRIYRVFPETETPRAMPRIDQMTIPQLVAALGSENGWLRDVAQYQLVNLTDVAQQQAATSGLRRLLATSDRPLARLHALWTLEGLQALSDEMIRAALTDPHAGVRRNALRLVRQRPVDPADLDPLLTDGDRKVRLQLVSALGELPGPAAANRLATLAIENAADGFITATVISSLNRDNVAGLLAETISERKRLPDEFVQTVFHQAAALGDDAARRQAVNAIAAAGSSGWAFAALAEMLDVDDRQLLGGSGARVEQVIEAARRSLASSGDAPRVRAAAARLLFRTGSETAEEIKLLERTLDPQTPPAVQQALVAHAGDQSDPRLADALLAGWRSHGPQLRSQILTTLSSRAMWMATLLDQFEQDGLLPGEVDATTRRRLLSVRDDQLRERAERLFEGQIDSDRRQVIAQYEEALALKADRTRGRVVFANKCATCHRLEDAGHEVGPNLTSITDKSPKSLLRSILDPSAVVESKYLDYTLVGRDGRIWTGMLATETATSITLLAADGKQQSILRAEIESLQSSGKSLMPDGIEKDLSLQQMADLIEFIRHNLATQAAP